MGEGSLCSPLMSSLGRGLGLLTTLIRVASFEIRYIIGINKNQKYQQQRKLTGAEAFVQASLWSCGQDTVLPKINMLGD